MTINYPTTLDTTTELPNNRADATVSATSHPEDHNDLANAVLALEAKVGVDSSTVTTSLDSKVRAGGLDARAYGTLTAASSGAAATNTATIEAAIAAAAASAIKTVLIPGGKYYVDDLQIDQAVTVRGHGMHLTTLAYTSTTGYGVTMTHAYAEMSDLKILYEGSGNASSGGHMLWENGRRLESISFEGADVTKKAYRYINHNGDPSAGWHWVGCVFGNSISAVVDCGVHLDQLGSWPMPGDGIITDCQFLDVVYAVPAMRIKGHPSLRILNPKFLGWSVGVLIDWSNSLGNSNGFYWIGGSCENFTEAGLRVDRASGTYTLVDSILEGVEFVPDDGSAGAVCVDIQDGSAPGWNINGNFMAHTLAGQIGVKLGSGADKVSITGNVIRAATTGLSVNSGATNVYVAGNYFQGCTTDVSDSGSVIAPVKIFNDANVKGYLHVGALSAPTNTADGDITADQIYVPKVIGSKTDASAGTLTLTTTDHATKGKILFGTASAYDEANDRWGIGTQGPTQDIHLTKSRTGDVGFYVQNSTTGDASRALFVLQNGVASVCYMAAFSSGHTSSLFGRAIAGLGLVNVDMVGTNTDRDLTLGSNNVQRITLTGGGNIVLGSAALATGATDGFLYLPTCAGAPSGTPTAYTGRVALVYDTTNNKLMAYNGAWKGVTLT